MKTGKWLKLYGSALIVTFSAACRDRYVVAVVEWPSGTPIAGATVYRGETGLNAALMTTAPTTRGSAVTDGAGLAVFRTKPGYLRVTAPGYEPYPTTFPRGIDWWSLRPESNIAFPASMIPTPDQSEETIVAVRRLEDRGISCHVAGGSGRPWHAVASDGAGRSWSVAGPDRGAVIRALTAAIDDEFHGGPATQPSDLVIPSTLAGRARAARR